MNLPRLVLACWMGSLACGAQAKSVDVLIGPPSVGQGGSNPVGLPPTNPIDWQVAYVNADNRETLISLIPGLLYGQRFVYQKVYATLGGGLLILPTAFGAGVYHAFGYRSDLMWSSLRYLAEYRQVVGLPIAGTPGLQFPYTLRMGFSYEF